MANITITSLAAQIDEIWSDELNAAIEFRLEALSTIDDRSKSMPHGDIYHYPSRHHMTAATKTAGTDVTPEAITEPDQTFTVNTHRAVAFMLEDIAAIQSKYDMRAEYTEDMMYPLGRVVENDLGALLSNNTTQTVGVLGQELTDGNMRRAWQYFEDNGAPKGDRFTLLSPAAYAGLLNLDKYTARQYVGEESVQVVRKAVIGDIYGSGVVMSNLTPGTAPNSDGHMYHRSHFFVIFERKPEVHSEYRARSLAWDVVADEIYGVFERQEPDEAAVATTNARLWGVRLRTLR